MHSKGSLKFQEVCHEVRSRFPSAFGSLSAAAHSVEEQDGVSWLSSLPDRTGFHQVLSPGGVSVGSLELLLGAVEETGRRGIRMVWIDPCDCLDPPTAFDRVPGHLLWARGGGLEGALRVADAVARDENFPFICLDGSLIAAAEWKRVPLARWYRLQRLVHRHATSLILWTPPVSIPPVECRWTVRGQWTFAGLFDRSSEELCEAIRVQDLSGRGQTRDFSSRESVLAG